MSRRDRLKILDEFLESVNKGYRNNPELMNKADMNYSQLKDYVDLALQEEFIREETGKYTITEKGKEYIKRYHRLVDLL